MAYNNYEMASSGVREGVSDFIRGVFTWMLLGLVITGIVASLVASDKPLILYLMTHSILFFVLIGLQLGAVIGLSFAIVKIPTILSEAIFLLYSALTGVTFSTILKRLYRP